MDAKRIGEIRLLVWGRDALTNLLMILCAIVVFFVTDTVGVLTAQYVFAHVDA